MSFSTTTNERTLYLFEETIFKLPSSKFTFSRLVKTFKIRDPNVKNLKQKKFNRQIFAMTLLPRKSKPFYRSILYFAWSLV